MSGRAAQPWPCLEKKRRRGDPGKKSVKMVEEVVARRSRPLWRVRRDCPGVEARNPVVRAVVGPGWPSPLPLVLDTSREWSACPLQGLVQQCTQPACCLTKMLFRAVFSQCNEKAWNPRVLCSSRLLGWPRRLKSHCPIIPPRLFLLCTAAIRPCCRQNSSPHAGSQVLRHQPPTTGCLT